MNTQLTIVSTGIRQDAQGRYCLNDCHKASGGEQAKKPANFLRLDRTRALIEEISRYSDLGNGSVNVMQGGIDQGTYAVKDLVYAYAMWINPTFHLQVIRAFDVLVTGQIAPPPMTREQQIAHALLLTSEIINEKDEQIAALAPKAVALDRIATANGSITVSEAAKVLQMSPSALFEWLQDHKWIFRRNHRSAWLGREPQLVRGYLEQKFSSFTDRYGNAHEASQVRITPKGMTKLATLIPQVMRSKSQVLLAA